MNRPHRVGNGYNSGVVVRTWAVRLALVAVLVLFASGLVLASSFVVDYPQWVVVSSLLVGAMAAALVALSAWRFGRAEGESRVRAARGAAASLLRFIRDFL